jgi:glucose-1-phosphate adenylyltransferase
MRTGEGTWYRGTADAIFQNINLIRDSRPDIVVVFAADHIYRMDIRQMINFHIHNNADATVAVLPVSVNEAHKFGIASVDKTSRIRNFIEKPKHPKALLKADIKDISVSMGNYIFNTDVLLDILLKDAHKAKSAHDFGKSIIPALVKTKKVFAYSFLHNTINGIRPYEEKHYWRDVGNLKSYWMANMDLLGEGPVFDLDNNEWPIIAAEYDGPPTRMVSGDIKNSIIGEGACINNAAIHNSVIGRGVTIGKNSRVEDSIIMDFNKIGENVRIKKAIIDRFNTIPDNATMGYNPISDRKRYFLDENSGLVILKRGGRDWP